MSTQLNEPLPDRREFNFEIADLAARLGVTEKEATEVVQRFCAQGILRKTAKGYQWVADKP